jgi:hypothetical protein
MLITLTITIIEHSLVFHDESNRVIELSLMPEFSRPGSEFEFQRQKHVVYIQFWQVIVVKQFFLRDPPFSLQRIVRNSPIHLECISLVIVVHVAPRKYIPDLLDLHGPDDVHICITRTKRNVTSLTCS